MVWYGIFGQKYNTYNQVYTSICPFIWIRLREASPPFLVSVCRRTIKDTLLKGVLNLAILTIFTVLYYMAHASTFGIPRKQALRNSCELLRQRKELHTSSGNCIQAHGTACKLMVLLTSCKLRHIVRKRSYHRQIGQCLCGYFNHPIRLRN